MPALSLSLPRYTDDARVSGQRFLALGGSQISLLVSIGENHDSDCIGRLKAQSEKRQRSNYGAEKRSSMLADPIRRERLNEELPDD